MSPHPRGESSRTLAWTRHAVGWPLLGGLLFALGFVLQPLPPGLLDRSALASLRVLDRSGGVLREVASRDGRNLALPPEQPLPTRLVQAFVAAEDRRFGSHPGVDPLAVGRALRDNLRAGRVVSGASSLAQQLARQLVPRQRTLFGKLQEALWAVRLTVHLPREALLRAYLDRVPLGRDLVGVEVAADAYFGRPARTLSLGQAALLAGLARAPTSGDPALFPEAARRRMGLVLSAMQRAGFVDSEEARAASAAPWDLVPTAHPFLAPHLVTDLLQRRASLGLAQAAEVVTTIDPLLQRGVEEALRAELASDGRVGQAAALVVDNATGQVLAYAGSADFLDVEREGQNDGVRALRQPGSALKPFVYGLALAQGWTPSSLLSDVEWHLSTPGGDYVPRNYDRRVHGPVRLRAALANSYNVPAVRVAEALGVERVLALLRAAGFASLSEDAAHYGVGLVLGNGDVSLWELARAYLGLARGGVLHPLVSVLAATDAEGRALEVPRELEPRRFLPRDAVALLTDILSDEAARAPAFGLDNALRLSFPVAAKTGTSRAYVDNWTVGFTQARTVAVWAGNFDGVPMHKVSGISGAGPIFARILALAMRGLPAGALVDRSRFEHVRVCALSGQRATAHCPSAVEEVFLPGTSPQEDCRMHRESGVGAGRHLVLDIGPDFYAWARTQGWHAGPWPDESHRGPSAELLSPEDGDEYLVEAGLPDKAQSIPVRVRPPPGALRLELRTEEGAVLPLLPPFTGRLPARRGRHRVELWLPGGTSALASAEYQVVGGR
ncbi:MAG: penicillin-binding protein 1C [Myxococcaceae bacterium]